MSSSLQTYIDSIKNPTATIPAIMDPKTLLSCINILFGENFSDISEIAHTGIHSVFLYDIPEGKKQLDIATIRQCISEISLKPYEGKNIIILRNFDTASTVVQNSALKLIEESPDYAVIILEVHSHKGLLPTILSRTILLFQESKTYELDTKTCELLEDYMNGNRTEWLVHLYQNEYTKEEAISILAKVFLSLNFEKQIECQKFLEALYTTHEKPRNILDAFFLSK